MDPLKDKVVGVGMLVATLSSIYLMSYLRADMARTCTTYPMDARWSSFRLMELGFVMGTTLVSTFVWRALVTWYRARKR